MKTKGVPEVCKNCRFWEVVAPINEQYEVGACKRFPPHVVVFEEDTTVVRPITEWKDSCGEFAVRLDA